MGPFEYCSARLHVTQRVSSSSGPSRHGSITLAPARRALCVVGLSLMGVWVSGCTDKAEAGFKKCEQLESSGKLEEALIACQSARASDPNSQYGTLATKKEIHLLTVLTAKKSAKVADEASQAEQERLQDAESKVQWQLESTPPNDKRGLSEKCMAMARDYENAYSCMPKDPAQVRPGQPAPFLEECKLLATSKGCKSLDADGASRIFCCGK
jgi:hypothetical protein